MQRILIYYIMAVSASFTELGSGSFLHGAVLPLAFVFSSLAFFGPIIGSTVVIIIAAIVISNDGASPSTLPLLFLMIGFALYTIETRPWQTKEDDPFERWERMKSARRDAETPFGERAHAQEAHEHARRGAEEARREQTREQEQADREKSHRGNRKTRDRQRPLDQALLDAYAILQVGFDADDDEVKLAYRKRIAIHHPDRLIGRSATDASIALATEETRRIRGAYELIRRERKRPLQTDDLS